MSARTHRSTDQWRELIGNQKTSGLTIAQFCQLNGLASSTFYRYQQIIGNACTDHSVDTMTDQQAAAITVPTSAFTPITTQADYAHDADSDCHPSFSAQNGPGSQVGSGWDIELDLGDGLCLRLRRH